MLDEIYALKAGYEKELIYAKAKLEVIDDLVARFTAHPVATEENETAELVDEATDENSAEDEFAAV